MFPSQWQTLSPDGTGADVLDNGLRLIAPETGEDVTDFHVRGGEYSLECRSQTGGSPSCDKDGIVGEVLRRGGINVTRVG